jgi:universal stress protein F
MGEILVGLDGSPRAPGVLDAAVSLARRVGDALVLFQSFGAPPEMPIGVWKLEEASLAENLREHAERYLEHCKRGVPDDVVASTDVRLGTPWQALCETAASMRADYIVIGSHGYGRMDRLLGTTAAKVVNHADCSVLVVRPPLPGVRP